MTTEQQVDEHQHQLVEQSVHQLKVSLQEIIPLVWRRIVVPSEITLGKLHEILQVTMGWDDDHLYLFEVSGRQYGEPDPAWGARLRNAGRAKLSKIAPGIGNSFIRV